MEYLPLNLLCLILDCLNSHWLQILITLGKPFVLFYFICLFLGWIFWMSLRSLWFMDAESNHTLLSIIPFELFSHGNKNIYWLEDSAWCFANNWRNVSISNIGLVSTSKFLCQKVCDFLQQEINAVLTR